MSSLSDEYFQANLGKEQYIMTIGAITTLFVVMLILFANSSMEKSRAEAQLANLEKKAAGAYQLYQERDKESKEVEEAYQKAKREINAVKEALGQPDANLEGILNALEGMQVTIDRFKDRIDQPPIITLTKSGGFTFPSGGVTLSTEFIKKLNDQVVPQIIKHSLSYGTDEIVVSGHTDEQAFPGAGRSDLDSGLVSFMKGGKKTLSPVSNTELGMARAVAVVAYLRNKPELKHLKFIPLSGAQLVLPGNRLSDGTDQSSNEERRRIEISLQRSKL